MHATGNEAAAKGSADDATVARTHLVPHGASADLTALLEIRLGRVPRDANVLNLSVQWMCARLSDSQP